MSGEESSEATGAGNNLLGDQAFISSVLSSVSLRKNRSHKKNEREK